MGQMRHPLVLKAMAGILVAFLALPVAALFLTASSADVLAGLRHPLVWPALRLSLGTSSITLVITLVLGTPLAWILARSSGRLARATEMLMQVPVMMPPAVAGIALLLAFGRRGLLGPLFNRSGVAIGFSVTAVVLAQLFVSAPLYVQAATSAFRQVDPSLVTVARTLGAGPLRIFLRIGLPLAGPGLVAGAALAWARALGEFGATLMFAGNLEGRTQTLPLAIYTALASDLRAAQAISMVLVVVAVALLVFMRAVVQRSTPIAGERR